MQKTSGFTLMELAITVAIIAIMSIIAIPNLISWFPQYRLNVAAREVVSTLQMARLKAIKGNTDIIVVINPANDTVTVFQDDGTGGADTSGDGVPEEALNWAPDPGESVFNTEPLPPGINITADFNASTAVRFNRRGFPMDIAGNLITGTVDLDNGRGGPHSQIEVQLDISGNARIN